MMDYKKGDIVAIYSDKYDMYVKAIVESTEGNLLWVYYYVCGHIENYVLPIEVEKAHLLH